MTKDTSFQSEMKTVGSFNITLWRKNQSQTQFQSTIQSITIVSAK